MVCSFHLIFTDATSHFCNFNKTSSVLSRYMTWSWWQISRICSNNVKIITENHMYKVYKLLFLYANTSFSFSVVSHKLQNSCCLTQASAKPLTRDRTVKDTSPAAQNHINIHAPSPRQIHVQSGTDTRGWPSHARHTGARANSHRRCLNH